MDDAPSTRRLLRAVLDTVASLDIAGEADSGQAAIETATDLQPDVILLDLSLPDVAAGGDGILPDLLKVAPGARVVIVSNNSRLAGPELVAAGAAGFIEKGLAPRALLDKLSSILQTPLTLEAALPEW